MYVCMYVYMYVRIYVCICLCICMCIYFIRVCIHTGCPGRNVPQFERMFFKLKYTDITKNTYIRSWKVSDIKAREKCCLRAVPRTVPGSRDVLPVHWACPSFSLNSAQAGLRSDCTCKLPGTLRATTTFVRVFMYFHWMTLCHADVN